MRIHVRYNRRCRSNLCVADQEPACRMCYLLYSLELCVADHERAHCCQRTNLLIVSTAFVSGNFPFFLQFCEVMIPHSNGILWNSYHVWISRPCTRSSVHLMYICAFKLDSMARLHWLIFVTPLPTSLEKYMEWNPFSLFLWCLLQTWKLLYIVWLICMHAKRCKFGGKLHLTSYFFSIKLLH